MCNGGHAASRVGGVHWATAARRPPTTGPCAIHLSFTGGNRAGSSLRLVWGGISWYREFPRFPRDNETYTWFAKLVAVGEVPIGIGLLAGCLVGFATYFRALMDFNFMLARTTSTNAILFAFAVALILAWKGAGYYGVDRYLLPILAAP